MRVDLKVPFEERFKAKALGARWDVVKKIWYVIDPDNLEPFAQWISYEVSKFFEKKPKRNK